MADRNTSRIVDAVPEADFVEQNMPAYPADGAEIEDTPDDTAAELSAAVERDAFSADPADVVEQSIPVPLDDDRDPDPDY